MGKEIVYCFRCQKRILGSEFERGQAYQLENSSCCSSCAVHVLETLPPKAKEQLLAKMFKATQERQQSNTSIPKPTGPGSTPRIPIVPLRPPAAPARSSTTPVVVIGIGIVVLVGVVLAVVSGGGSPPPTSTVAPPPPKPRPQPPDPGLSPEEQRRASVAKESLRKARDFAQANPKDLEGQARQWRAALTDAQKTGYEAEAKRELEKTEIRVKETLAQEVVDFEKRAQEITGRRDYAAALDLVAKERLRKNTPEWVAVLDRVERDIRAAAARRFAELKEQAIAARIRGAKAEIDAAKSEVAKWGIPEYLPELDVAVQGAWTPIFDGKTNACLSRECLAWWQVVDGALYPVKGNFQAGQSKTDFGDGEIRFRFASKGCSLVALSVRQGDGSCRLSIYRSTLEAMGEGAQEVVFTCRGAQVTATVNGKPMNLELPPKILPRGRLQFGNSEGEFRLLGLDYRELP
jgi:hypothetical protein